jgi:hypothetical protein
LCKPKAKNTGGLRGCPYDLVRPSDEDPLEVGETFSMTIADGSAKVAVPSAVMQPEAMRGTLTT